MKNKLDYLSYKDLVKKINQEFSLSFSDESWLCYAIGDENWQSLSTEELYLLVEHLLEIKVEAEVENEK